MLVGGGCGDFTVLREHGFSDPDIWDIGAVAAFSPMSNRMANMTSMRANDEFFLISRLPKGPDPGPSRARGDGSFVSRVRDFYINQPTSRCLAC